MNANPQRYMIRGMVCHRCDLALAELAENIGIEVISTGRGFVTFTRPLTTQELDTFEQALQVIKFGLIRDEDEQLAEQIELRLLAVANRRPIPEWKHVNNELRTVLEAPYDYAVRAYLKVFDCTPLERLTTLRIQQATVLLREGELQVSEISEAVGYSHLSGFSRAFKRELGVSPSTYSTE
jgi:AraC-like DNA-binding protein